MSWLWNQRFLPAADRSSRRGLHAASAHGCESPRLRFDEGDASLAKVAQA